MTKGKFDTDAAEYLYSLTLDGCGEEVGDVQNGGHHTRLSFNEREAHALNETLPEDERHGRACWFDNDPDLPEIVTGYSGAIVHEDEQGFVTVTLCETSMELDEEWNRIEHIHSAYESMVGSD